MTAPKKIAVGLFSLAILGGGYLAWFPFHTLNTSVARGGQPVVDCPAEVDLGVQTLGSMTAGELVISNQGGEVLVLDNLQTSCSCMGFDVEVGGEFRSFGRMELAPAEKVRARVRVTVQESVGNGVNVFQFGTNDPLRPTVRVRVRAQVIGAKLLPGVVSFGDVRVGESTKEVIEVRDLAPTSHRIISASASDIERISVRVLKAGLEPERTVDGTQCIARVEITTKSDQPGSLDDVLVIMLDGGKNQRLEAPIRARFVLPITASPSELVLPLRSTNGPLYSAMCVIRGELDGPLFLTVAKCPSDLLVELQQVKANERARLIKITLANKSAIRTTSSVRQVLLRGQQGGAIHDVAIKVILREE